MKSLARTALVSAMAMAMVALGLPGGNTAYAASAPVLTSVWLEAAGVATTSVDEAQTFFVKGTFTDVDAESHFVKVKIGSTFAETTTGLAFGERGFSIAKFYLDDNPTGTAQDPFTLTVRVQDQAGLFSNVWTMTVNVRNVPPSITSFSFVPTTALENESVTASGVFADPGTRDTFTLTLSWGDGSPAFTRSYLSTDAKTFSATHTYAAAGSFTITATVTDDDAGSGATSGALGVGALNTAPSALTLSGASVTEDDEATFNGQFTDPDPADTHTVRITWGDGASSDLPLGAGVTSFVAKHTYADDGTYGVGVTVTDAAGTSTSTGLSFVVFKRNTPPNGLALGTTNAVVGAPGKVMVSFADPDPLDWHRVTILWGDGSPATEHLLDAAVFSVEASHVYSAAGTYTVAVTVVDTFSASVNGSGALEVRLPSASELVDELTGMFVSWDLDNSFTSKILAVQSQLSWGRNNACNQLGALANHVAAQTGKNVSLEQAASFWSVVASLDAGMDCAQLETAEVKASQRAASATITTSSSNDKKDKKTN